MMRNQLYGYFGRDRDLIQTRFVNKEQLVNIIKTSIAKAIVEVNDDLFIVLIKNNVNYKLIKELNCTLDQFHVDNLQQSVKSNVAISAAITAYARMTMMDYKNNPDFNIYYSDTDSIFIDHLYLTI
jgi:hypothetical protein